MLTFDQAHELFQYDEETEIVRKQAAREHGFTARHGVAE